MSHKHSLSVQRREPPRGFVNGPPAFIEPGSLWESPAISADCATSQAYSSYRPTESVVQIIQAYSSHIGLQGLTWSDSRMQVTGRLIVTDQIAKVHSATVPDACMQGKSFCLLNWIWSLRPPDHPALCRGRPSGGQVRIKTEQNKETQRGREM